MNRFILRFVSIIFLIAWLTSCAETQEESTNSAETTPEEVDYEGDGSELTYEQQIVQNYQVYAMPIPEGLSFAGEEVPLNNIIVHEALDREIHSNTYWHSNTFFYLKRAHRWFPIIEPILEENGVPEDFKYLAVIESGLINATSPSGAKGFWQFMKKTGQDYSLEISEDVDERLHLEKATHAACEYLTNAYKKFDNWTLAAASYNMGKAGLKGQLAKQKADNYYDLLLNIETGRYVYRILAVKCIFENPEQYGFNFRTEDLYPPYQTKTITVDSSISNIAEFANSVGTNYKTLKMLNPWLKNNKLSNKSGKVYEFLLPEEGQGLDMIGEYSTKYVTND
jgi:hypothetical protein